MSPHLTIQTFGFEWLGIRKIEWISGSTTWLLLIGKSVVRLYKTRGRMD